MALEGGPVAERKWKLIDHRNLIEALRPGSGTLREDDFVLTPAGVEAGHAAQLSPGRAIATGAAFRQGSYFAWSDGAQVIPWPGPDSEPRIDTLLLQWYDPSMGSVTQPGGPAWVIVPGQAAPSPVPRSDTAIAADYAEPGAYLIAYDVRINPGQTSISAGSITRRFGTLTSRARAARLKVTTGGSSAFRTWCAQAPATRKAFLTQYWDPVRVVVPYTGEVKVSITGKTLNSSSPNAGVSFCYTLSGANTTGISDMTDWEYLSRSQFNETSTTSQRLTGLNPGETVFTPTLWVSETTTSSGVGITSGELLVEPIF